MTTVATFWKPEEAHLFRMRLASSGIDSFIQDESIIQLDMLFANVLGGVRVQVAEEDVPAVRELLAEDPGVPAEADEPRCPKCGATAIETEQFSRWFAYLTLVLIHIPILYFRRRLRCGSCLHTWKP